jgi:hypothetical protein
MSALRQLMPRTERLLLTLVLLAALVRRPHRWTCIALRDTRLGSLFQCVGLLFQLGRKSKGALPLR